MATKQNNRVINDESLEDVILILKCLKQMPEEQRKIMVNFFKFTLEKNGAIVHHLNLVKS